MTAHGGSIGVEIAGEQVTQAVASARERSQNKTTLSPSTTCYQRVSTFLSIRQYAIVGMTKFFCSVYQISDHLCGWCLRSFRAFRLLDASMKSSMKSMKFLGRPSLFWCFILILIFVISQDYSSILWYIFDHGTMYIDCFLSLIMLSAQFCKEITVHHGVTRVRGLVLTP